MRQPDKASLRRGACSGARLDATTSVEALPHPSHEPYPLIPSFSPSGGEGARRAAEGDSDRFKVPTRVQFLEVFALHEPPPHPFPLPIRWGEGGREVG